MLKVYLNHLDGRHSEDSCYNNRSPFAQIDDQFGELHHRELMKLELLLYNFLELNVENYVRIGRYNFHVPVTGSQRSISE